MGQRPSLRRLLAAALLLALVGAGARECRPPEGTILYSLRPASHFLEGCFPPCLCPTLLADVQGTFRLLRLPGEPASPFQTFEVSGVSWLVERGGEHLFVSGFGRYEIGGEFALMHRLVLDLRLGDEPPRRFDSGFVVGGREFPDIAIAVSVGQQVCFDTLFEIDATPLARFGPDPV